MFVHKIINIIRTIDKCKVRHVKKAPCGTGTGLKMEGRGRKKRQARDERYSEVTSATVGQ